MNAGLESALWLAAPLLALLFILLWFGVAARRGQRLTLRIKFLGLTLDVKTDDARQAD